MKGSEVWKKMLNSAPVDWLLEIENPSVKYFTMTELLDYPIDNNEVIQAKNAIMKLGVVPQILAKQHINGYWDIPQSFYTNKYQGTSWQLLILAEFGAERSDERVKKACEFILGSSQDFESSGFSMWTAMRTGGGRHSGVIPCLTGNMVYSLIRLGYLHDTRVQAAVNWITQYQRFDDATPNPPVGWPYDEFEMCFGRHTCHMGAVKALKALSEIPPQRRTPQVQATLQNGAEYMLKHHIFKRSHDLNRISKPGWLLFGFPLMYQTDALEIFGVLSKLGYKDPRMAETADLVLSKMGPDGRWLLENTYNGRFQANIERKGAPSKWITLKALSALKRWYS
jgi:hypothetical protein